MRGAGIAGAAAALATIAGIYAGSRNLRNFDVALVGYAVATVVLAYGLTRRLFSWMENPAARRYLAGIWSALVRPGPRRRPSPAVPRAMLSTILLQRFIASRGRGRWLAHQGMFWGVVLATAMTFPLTFGWIHFRTVPGSGSGYTLYFLGWPAARFDALSTLGWLLFHGLDVAAILVGGGCIYFLHRRLAARHENPVDFVRDLLPLLALLGISVTGLALTASSLWWGGLYYHQLALAHMVVVVLTLLWIPFGKFVHTVQRPAMAGIHAYKADGVRREGTVPCRGCGEPLESAAFLADLRSTMGELGLGFAGWVDTCPRCKRVARGSQYRSTVKAGF